MKKIGITVSVNLDLEYLDNIDVEIEVSDESYEELLSLCGKMDEEELGDEESHDLLQEEAPEVLNEIDTAVNNAMPDEIELQEDESIDDYSWEPEYNTITFE